MALIIDDDPAHRLHGAVRLAPGTVLSICEHTVSHWPIGTLVRIKSILTEHGRVFIEVAALGEEGHIERIIATALSTHKCPDCPHDSPEHHFG